MSINLSNSRVEELYSLNTSSTMTRSIPRTRVRALVFHAIGVNPTCGAVSIRFRVGRPLPLNTQLPTSCPFLYPRSSLCYDIMPSHTAASGLIKMYENDGAPWQWQAWKERTGIHHGLFPDDDEHLPPGWSRQDALDVKAYFDAYTSLTTEDQKIKFATKPKGGGSNFPGRLIWNSFVSRYWNKWGLHGLIVMEFREADIHPMAIMSRETHLNGSWPHADNYVPNILDTLGMKVFGEDAFPPNCLVLSTPVRRSLQVFAQRSWNTIRGQVRGLRTRRNEIEATAKAAFVDLETDKPTKAKVTHTIRAVARWKDTAEIFGLPEDLKNAESMLEELKAIMEGLGTPVEKRSEMKPKGACRVSAQALNNLAREEDVTELIHVYREYFDARIDEEDEQPLAGPLAEDRSLNDSTGDLGMEVESTMSLTAICKALGFHTGLPLQFNKYRHRAGVTPWDNETIFKVAPLPKELELLRLHWHQLAGVHSIVRSLFTEQRDIEHSLGVLIGDEVGLGKTAQAITTIGFFNQLIHLKANNQPLPPVIKDRPWLAGSQKIPSQPHLIVCPGTLVAQWVHELQVLLRCKIVDIFTYDSQTNSKAFWGPDGPVQRSIHKPHDRIIVASHSVIFNDFRKLHSNVKKKKKKDANPWEIPPVKPSQTLKDTVFGQFFLTVTVDEAHHMRNLGNKQISTLRLLQQAKVRLIMTATPIHTAPKDIISMGRLVNLDYFFSELCIAEEKEDNALIRKAKKFDDDGESLRAARMQITRRLHDRCRGHFLRRTTNSYDWVGRTLLPLPPYLEIIGLIKLSDREILILQDRQEAAKAALLSASSSNRIQTKTFYLEYRTGVGFAQEDVTAPYPVFKSLAEWELKMSTKMTTCALMCAHYLTHDDVPDVSFVDRKLVLPKVEVLPGQQVLKLYGVSSLAINGQMSFDKRDACITKLHDPKSEERVLIFSSVGSAGLNLAIADVVIFFDQPWSAQDEQQIRGRAHRQPQKKIVKVIYLLAMESADLLLHGVARGKRDMFNAFMNNQLAEELQSLLQGLAIDIPPVEEPQPTDDLDSVADEEPTPAPKPRRTRKPWRQIVVDEETSETPGAGPSTLPMEAGDSSDGARMSVGDEQETRSVNMSDPEGEAIQCAIQRSLEDMDRRVARSDHSHDPEGEDIQRVIQRSLGKWYELERTSANNKVPTSEDIIPQDARSDHSRMDVDVESGAESAYSDMSIVHDHHDEASNSRDLDNSPPSKRAKTSGSRIVHDDSSDGEALDQGLIALEQEIIRQGREAHKTETFTQESKMMTHLRPETMTSSPTMARRPDIVTSSATNTDESAKEIAHELAPTSTQQLKGKMPEKARKRSNQSLSNSRSTSQASRRSPNMPLHGPTPPSTSHVQHVLNSPSLSHADLILDDLAPDEEGERPPPTRPSRSPGPLRPPSLHPSISTTTIAKLKIMWTFPRDDRGNVIFPLFRRQGSDWFTSSDAKLISVLDSTYNTAANRWGDDKSLRETFVITTPNTNWLPQIDLGVQDVRIYHDGRWGTADFTQWPQWYFDEQDHFAYILRKPSAKELEHHPLRYLWFEPELEHFLFMNDGQEVGRFLPQVGLGLYKLRTLLLEEVLNCRCPDGGIQRKLNHLANQMKNTTSTIVHTPQSYLDAMYTYTCAQRSCLEVRALLDKIQKWDELPPLKDPRPVNNAILGCVTDRAPVVDGLYAMGVPVWYVRPLSHIASSMTILKQCPCTSAKDFGIDLVPWPGTQSFYTGPLFCGIYKLLQDWQPGAIKKFPLEAISTTEPTTIPTSTPASTSHAPYSTTSAINRVVAKSSTKLFTVNKQLFDAKSLPHHPEPIDAWKKALQSIDTSVELVDHPRQSLFRGYAFPPPLLFSSPNEERNIDTMLAWILIRPSWISLISTPSRTKPLPGPQQWRDFLNKLALDLELVWKDTRTSIAKQSRVDPPETNLSKSTSVTQSTAGCGKKKKANTRRLNLKSAIPEIFSFPAPSKSQLQLIEWEGRRVWDSGAVPLSSQDRKLIVWDSQEHNFRLELLSLDRVIMESVWATAAGRAARETKHKNVWPDGVCFMLGLPTGGMGMGGSDVKARYPFIKAFRDIVVNWPGIDSRKLGDMTFPGEMEAGQGSEQARVDDVERAVAKIYCQQFFAHFGRAPCIPHCFPGL
ncbi:hypothetical protein NP233_g6859 [Leucocoprinus birnbaumii]|uniref:Uncharacterized protein n=1 Tax=Leucocoprinus birnbaumii TaxID=56174 RepID=A0AAD5VT18_9AGAR|nr:hypothetical protein NP233_g6859 [Leucocoprinus birnbaumii]